MPRFSYRAEESILSRQQPSVSVAFDAAAHNKCRTSIVTDSSNHAAAVIGAGWSGIAAAWYLLQSGYEVTVYDQSDMIGGRSATTHLGGRSVTLGGKNIGSRYTLFREFVHALGFDAFEAFGINSSRVQDGRIRTVDGHARVRSALELLSKAPLSDTINLLRLVRSVRRNDANRFLRGPDFQSLIEHNGDRTMDGYFGTHLQTHLVRPMTVRMNGAEPDEAYLGNFGTNLGMLFDRFDQLREGFDQVFNVFGSLVRVELGVRVRGLVFRNGVISGVKTDTGGGWTDRPAGVVVLATSSGDAADLVQPFNIRLAAALREIRYFPVAVAIAEYSAPVFTQQARALVLPADSPVSNAGAYGIDDRHIVRYTFSGRTARQFLESAPDTEGLASVGENELTKYLPVSAQDRLNAVSGQWRQGLCGYGPSHDERLTRIETEYRRTPGLVLTGDYWRGASIEACFRAARDAVTAA